MILYTDYPIIELGDKAGEKAPIRRVMLLGYDGDKYCKVQVCDSGVTLEVKAGYLYTEAGRCGEVPCVDRKLLRAYEIDTLQHYLNLINYQALHQYRYMFDEEYRLDFHEMLAEANLTSETLNDMRLMWIPIPEDGNSLC